MIDFSRLPEPIIDNHPDWVTLYQTAWRLAAEHIRVSRGRRHMDAAWDPNRNYQWVWDTCFMALYCRYAADQYPGVESLDNFYDLQRDDGYISMTYDLETGTEPWPDRINPPLFAWVEWEHYVTTGDASRLARVVPHIERLMQWIDDHRRTKPHRRVRAKDNASDLRGGSEDTYQLYYFRDCGSSGMDDSPRAPREAEAGQYFDWIDLSSQMALSWQMLGKIYGVLNAPAEAARCMARQQELGDLINAELWCERTAFYHDRALPRNFVPSKTVAAFWPLLAGICHGRRQQALIAHLRNPQEFWRPLPVPSLSADDPNYCAAGTYWIGGVWAPTNYMIARGLQHCGQRSLAHELAVRYLTGMAETYAQVAPATLWECYSPEAPRPGAMPYTGGSARPDFVGWSGLGPIAMLLENVIGIDLDAAHGRLTWSVQLTGRHGVRRLPVGAGQFADLIFDNGTVTIRSGRALRCDILAGDCVTRIEAVPDEIQSLQLPGDSE